MYAATVERRKTAQVKRGALGLVTLTRLERRKSATRIPKKFAYSPELKTLPNQTAPENVEIATFNNPAEWFSNSFTDAWYTNNGEMRTRIAIVLWTTTRGSPPTSRMAEAS